MTKRTLRQIGADAQDELVIAKAHLAKHVEFLKEGSSAAQSKNDAHLIGKSISKANRLYGKSQDYHNDLLDVADSLDEPLGDDMAARR